jgi:hypothetical protein
MATFIRYNGVLSEGEANVLWSLVLQKGRPYRFAFVRRPPRPRLFQCQSTRLSASGFGQIEMGTGATGTLRKLSGAGHACIGAEI